MCLTTERWGPAWSTSAFPFENYNGILSRLTHGTEHIGQEIINKIKIAQGFKILENKVNRRLASASSALPSCVGTNPVPLENVRNFE